MAIPTISVVIPHADQPQTLMNAVMSALRQTRKPSEVIVVENSELGLSDVLYNELVSLGVKVVDCEAGNGASYARNIGVGVSSSEFVAFLDADDIWMQNKLSVVSEILSASNTACITSDFIFFKGLKVKRMPLDFENQNIFLSFHTGFGSTGVVNREVFDFIGGFDVELKRFEDWDFILRLKEHSFSYLHIRIPLVEVNRMPTKSWEWAHFSIQKFKSKPRNITKAEAKMLKSGIAFEMAVISFRKCLVLSLFGHLVQAVFYSPAQMKLLLKMSGLTRNFL